MKPARRRRSAEEVMDQEANYFAMCLLMPEDFVRREVDAMGGIDLTEEKPLAALARKFAVSPGMMAIRLGQLGFVRDV